MRDPNPVIVAAKALRDNLTLTGAQPEILRKLNAIVDQAEVGAADFEKLKNLISQAGDQR